MRILPAIAAISLILPGVASAQSTDGGTMSSGTMRHSNMKKHKNASVSSGTAGYTSNTESGGTTPQSRAGASTDGSSPGTSAGAPISTGTTTSSTGSPVTPQ